MANFLAAKIPDTFFLEITIVQPADKIYTAQKHIGLLYLSIPLKNTQMGLASVAACECGAIEQTAENVIRSWTSIIVQMELVLSQMLTRTW